MSPRARTPTLRSGCPGGGQEGSAPARRSHRIAEKPACRALPLASARAAKRSISTSVRGQPAAASCSIRSSATGGGAVPLTSARQHTNSLTIFGSSGQRSGSGGNSTCRKLSTSRLPSPGCNSLPGHERIHPSTRTRERERSMVSASVDWPRRDRAATSGTSKSPPAALCTAAQIRSASVPRAVDRPLSGCRSSSTSGPRVAAAACSVCANQRRPLPDCPRNSTATRVLPRRRISPPRGESGDAG